jgi:hypothetical protein
MYQAEKNESSKDIQLLTEHILKPQQTYYDIESLKENIYKMNNLSEECEQTKDVVGKLSIISLVPMITGLIYLANSFSPSHNTAVLIGMLSFLVGMVSLVGIVIAMVTESGRNLWQFNWVKKLITRLPHFKNRQKNLDRLKNDLYAHLAKEDFKHDYLTHVQYKIMQYQQLLKMLCNENEQYYFDDIESLKETIVNLKRQQSVIVRLMIDNNHKQLIKELLVLESMFCEVDEIVIAQENNQKQHSFIENHKNVLEKRGLTDLIEQAESQWLQDLPQDKKLEAYL